MQRSLEGCRRIVVKAGTTTLTSTDGHFSVSRLEKLGAGILSVRALKKEVALVSSGAIARGMEVMGFSRRPREMVRLQACAAIGQGKLIHDYENFFSRRDLHTAQVLLTRDGLETRNRFLSARRTFEELFRLGLLPIVNENDTVATEEIRFGDNDILSVHVAHLIHADLLILLSDVDGFFLEDGTRIRVVPSAEEIDRDLIRHLRDRQKQKNVGGMRAKLEAAKVAMRLGIPMLIVDGGEEGILSKVIQNEDKGTLFLPSRKTLDARKKWISFSAAKQGALTVDEGAYQALSKSARSLLASGIRQVEGTFESGSVIEIKTVDGNVFGRGVARLSSRELQSVMGKGSDEIRKIYGEKAPTAVIHRNDLVVWA